MWQNLPKSGKGSWAACYTHYTFGLVGTMALPHSHEFSIVCEVTCCVMVAVTVNLYLTNGEEN